MRRLLAALALGGLAWAALARRRPARAAVIVGYEDGSALTLEEGAPQLEPLLRAAREAL